MAAGHNLSMAMSFNEADTRAKLIDPALRECGWTEDHIFREQTAGAIDLIGGRARRQDRLCPSSPRESRETKKRMFSGVKVRDVIRLIEADGWFLVATRGSHRQYKHAQKPGRVTVAGKPSDDMAPGTLNSVLAQSGLKEKK